MQAVLAGQIVSAVETAWDDYTYSASQTVQAVEAVPDAVAVQIVPAAVDVQIVPAAVDVQIVLVDVQIVPLDVQIVPLDVQIVPAVWILAGITSD